jgi:hypothetical protein
MISRIISLIVGIIFLVVAVQISAIISNVTPQINHGIAVCNSTLGRLGSLIFHDRAQECQQVTQDAPLLVTYGGIAEVAFFIAGGYCVGYGGVGVVQMARRRATLA